MKTATTTRRKSAPALKTAPVKKSPAKPAPQKPKREKPQPQVQANAPEAALSLADRIPLALIDLSPFNYRKYEKPHALKELAQDIQLHGILSAIIVRIVTPGRYELVVGSRRVEASRMAGETDIPGFIQQLTDEQVIECQLSENLQREDPHPLDDANGIAVLLNTGKNIAEIAARLAKSPAFVYSRLKLLDLIPAFQEMLYADAMSLNYALQIAALSADSQELLYEDNCEGWQDKPGFIYTPTPRQISVYLYDLTKAPFDIADPQLLPAAGACTGCRFNSALVQDLFPETATRAECKNKTCYSQKCTAAQTLQFVSLLTEHEPVALVYKYNSEATYKKIIEATHGAAELPVFDYYDVSVVRPPEMPDKGEYDEEYEDADEAYAEAMADYEQECEQYQQDIAGPEVQKGILLTQDGASLLYFLPDKRSYATSETDKVTAKTIEDALRTGTATPEMLQKGITQINERERRNQTLDREKVQEAVHATFIEALTIETPLATPAADIATRLLVYQSLASGHRSDIDELLQLDEGCNYFSEAEALYKALAAMSTEQYQYMIALALAGKPEAKRPTSATGYTLYKLAEQSGTDVQSIESAQNEKAKTRQQRAAERADRLQWKKDKLTKTV